MKNGGGILSLILAFIAVLVTFNTIRLTMYAAKEEISIMKLVGASNWFVKGPFVVEGMVYGVIASVISIGILYPLVALSSPYLTTFMPGTDILRYFQSNLLMLFAIQVVVGTFLGTTSSLVAIRRYLKV